MKTITPFGCQKVWWIWSEEGAHQRATQGSGSAYEVRRFRKKFRTTSSSGSTTLFIPADSRYELHLDGRLIGRGPAHGDVRHQMFDRHELSQLSVGEHLVAVRVFDYSGVQCDPPRLGAPAAVMTRTGGLVMEIWQEADGSEGELLAASDASWRVMVDRSLGFHEGRANWFGGFVGLFEEFHPEHDQAPDWKSAEYDDSHWAQALPMYPAERFDAITDALSPYGLMERMTPFSLSLPAVSPAAVFTDGGGEAPPEWLRAVRGEGEVTMAADTEAAVLIELGQEWTGFPELWFHGGEGAEIRLGYAEALRHPKGDADAVVFGDGCDSGDVMIGYDDTGIGWTFDRRGSFEGFEDVLRPDGRSWQWSPHHWRCAKILRLHVRTGAEPLRLGPLKFYPGHHPLESEPFHCSDERLERVHDISLHTLRLGMHETFLDCPYYEQLQYIGDSSLNAQVAMLAGGAYPIARQLVRHFDWSRVPEGWTQSRYPSRVEGIIPSQSLDWIAAIHAYTLQSGDRATARAVWPGALTVLDAYERHCGSGGLPEALPYWNWIDWCPGWKRGVPPGAEHGPVLSHAAKYAIALKQAVEIAAWLDEPDTVLALEKRMARLRRAARAVFWNGTFFSENSNDRAYGSRLGNALAVLAGFADKTEGTPLARLLASDRLADCSFFGYHFVRQALWQLGECDLERELQPWFQMLDYGLTTWAEDTTYWRSLCHAWSANPCIDFFTRLLGVRPLEPGFIQTEITPAVTHYTAFSGAVATPHGLLRVDWNQAAGRVKVVVPPGITATLRLPERMFILQQGEHAVTCIGKAVPECMQEAVRS